MANFLKEGEVGMGPNGFRCYVNDTFLPDGRSISAHCIMAVLGGDLSQLKALLEPLDATQVGEEGPAVNTSTRHLHATYTPPPTTHPPTTTTQVGDLLSLDHLTGGMSLLDAACYIGHVAVIAYLGEQGSDVAGRK